VSGLEVVVVVLLLLDGVSVLKADAIVYLLEEQAPTEQVWETFKAGAGPQQPRT
jgi:hypothetical protein